MSLACTRMSSVCHSYVLVCHPYVTRMYSYVIRMSLVCTRMLSVCHSYVVLPWILTFTFLFNEMFYMLVWILCWYQVTVLVCNIFYFYEVLMLVCTMYVCQIYLYTWKSICNKFVVLLVIQSVKNVRIRSFFRSVFSRVVDWIPTGQIWENTGQKNVRIRTLFRQRLRSVNI